VNSAEEDGEAPPPRQTTVLFGHAAAEREFLDAYRSGRIPHAWLIGGEMGIGKATLAYRIARFILASPDPTRRPASEATTLDIDPAHPAVRRVAVNAHSDLLVLERSEGDSGKLRTVITVDQVRRLTSFFGSTAGEGGWRVCIVDSADELKFPEGSNALLKMLEEPPAHALFLLVSHAPGRLLPTIRSRCRKLNLKPLAMEDVVGAATAALGLQADRPRIEQAAQAAGGSVARALVLAGGPRLELHQRVIAMLADLPATDPTALHALGDRLDGSDRDALSVFLDAVRNWLSRRLDLQQVAEAQRHAASSLARVADVWDRLNRQARDVETYNLDRKPLVFAVFGLLAEAARG